MSAAKYPPPTPLSTLTTPTPEAQEAWVEHSNSLVEGSIRTDPSCNSWYVGANIPGKRRVVAPYAGGQPLYRERCEAVVSSGYEGLEFSA